MSGSYLAYWNGRFLPLNEIRIALNDAGFVFGATVTDLCRTFQRRPYRLAEHLTRFRNSASLARIPLPVTDADLQAICDQLIQANAARAAPETEWLVVFVATPGPLGFVIGLPGGPDEAEPTVIVYAYPLPYERYAPLMLHGARLETSAVRHVPPDTVPPQIKQRSRLHWWRADRLATPGTSALLLDEHGFVTETSTANLVVVRHGCVLSPRLSRVLPGVSLSVLRRICGHLQVPIMETDLRPEDCYGASEAWLCSTPYCLAPVAQLDGHPFPCPGPLYERVMACWSEEVGVDIRGAFLASLQPKHLEMWNAPDFSFDKRG